MLPICIYLISNTFLHDLATIRLRAHEGHPRGRAEHLLLDPLHLHHPQRLLEADRWAGHRSTAGMARVMTVTVQVLMLLTPASTRQ